MDNHALEFILVPKCPLFGDSTVATKSLSNQATDSLCIFQTEVRFFEPHPPVSPDLTSESVAS